MKEKELSLGIDLGGTKILTSVMDSTGMMLSRDHSITPAANGQDAVLEAIFESSGRALKEANVPERELNVVGIGAPGLSNPDTGVLYTSPNLPGWKNVPLGDIIADRLGKPVYLLNDGSAAAVGEMYFGAGRGYRNFIYITVSTGIGGGIVIAGKVYSGSTGTAGEIGHMVIDDNGPLCNCGNTGCWEMLASGTALAAEARRIIERGASSRILELANGDSNNVNAELIHRAAVDGDELALRLIARTAYYLGVGFANLINIFNPELIVIGGGLSNIGDMLLSPAYEEAGRRAFKQPFHATRFLRAELRRNSGVVGAAAYAFERYRKDRGGG